jgi:hypothetical protein
MGVVVVLPAEGPAGGGRREEAAFVHRLGEENAALREELSRRHLTDLATGILAAQLRVAPSEAGEHLARLAESASLSREDIAADIVNGVAGTIAVTAPGSTAAGPDGAPGDGVPPQEEARRLRRVVTAAEAAATVSRGADTLLEGGLRPLGAEALWLWRLTASGCLRLAGHAGVSALEASQWQWIPPAAPAPVRAAFTDGAPVWLPTGLPPGEMLPGPSEEAARALFPLRLRGRTVGLALAVWPAAADLTGSLRGALTGLVEVAARVLAAEEVTASEQPVLDDLLDALAHPAMILCREPGTGALLVEHVNGPAGDALGGSHRAVGRPVEPRSRCSTSISRPCHGGPGTRAPRSGRRDCPPSTGSTRPRRWWTYGCCRRATTAPSCCGTPGATTARPAGGPSAGSRAWRSSRTPSAPAGRPGRSRRTRSSVCLSARRRSR